MANDLSHELLVEMRALRQAIEQLHVALFRALTPSRNGAAPQPILVVDSIVLSFPTVGANGSTWALTTAHVDEWQALYPGIDVMQECRNALSWCKANPSRRKTVSGMPKFLSAWLTRAQNRGGRSPKDGNAGPGSGSALLDEAGYYDKR